MALKGNHLERDSYAVSHSPFDSGVLLSQNGHCHPCSSQVTTTI